MVDRLAAAGLGVVAVARSVDSLAALRDRVPGLVACAADIADDAAIEAIAAAVDRPVRMVVHGPGVAVAGGILTAPTGSMVDAVNIKVGGLLRLSRAVDGWLAAGSRIVAIGGHYGFEPTAYAASAGVANAALVNVVRQLSLAYGPRGVTAHLIAPGPADTERLRRLFVAHVRQPRHTLLHGQSWGASVAAKGAEMFQTTADGKRPYDAVLLASGVLAGAPTSSRTAASLSRLRPPMAHRRPVSPRASRYSMTSRPVKPVAPCTTMSNSFCMAALAAR